VLPMPAIFEHGWTPYQFSLHAASGLWQVQVLLFALAAGLAAALLVGYHTRLATAASWLLLVSLQNRNVFIGQGGDDLLRMLLFWGFFLPWGRVWSWDARQQPAPARLDYFSAATVAYIVQLALLYWCTALLKNGPEWTQTGTALYYAFSLDQVVLPIGRLLYPHPDLLRFLTFGAYYTELLLPFALFLPVGVARWRLLVVGVLFGFHLGISLTLYAGLFFLINMASVLGLLPPVAMAWLEQRLLPHAHRARRWPPLLPACLASAVAPAPGAHPGALGREPAAGPRHPRNHRSRGTGLRVLVEPRRCGLAAPRRRADVGADALVWVPVSGRPALGYVCAHRVQRRWLVHSGSHHHEGRGTRPESGRRVRALRQARLGGGAVQKRPLAQVFRKLPLRQQCLDAALLLQLPAPYLA
jgi:hypothetical protein